jgi:hypothetical protein
MYHIPCPSHKPLFDHSSNIWWRILFMKLLSTLSSLFPCYLAPLRLKYLPQCVIIRRPQPVTYEMAICHNPHTFSNWDSCITRQLVYQHTLCQNAVSTKHYMSLYFCKNITYLGVGLLKIGQVFLSRVQLCTCGLWQTAFSGVLCSCCELRDQVSHTYKILERTIVLYTLIFVCSDTKMVDPRFCTDDSMHSLSSICS